MGKIISIIIPAYNMEKYLRRCIESLVIPNFDEVEVLIVNDGSKDNTTHIAHDFATRFPDSVIVIDKENGNYGSCINVGLQNASGRYIKILDADDFFDTESFGTLTAFLKNTDVEVVLTDFNHVEHDSLNTFYGRELHRIGFPARCITDFKTASDLIPYPLMHLITYRRDLLQRIAYRQTEKASYTDTEWCFAPFASANTFYYLPVSVYRYVIGRQGQTVSTEAWLKSNSSFFKIITNLIETYNRLRPLVDSTRQKYLDNYLSTVYHSVLLRNLNSHDPDKAGEFEQFDSELARKYPDFHHRLKGLPLSRWSRWPVVDKWRHAHYSPSFRIPTMVTLGEKINKQVSRIKRFCKLT